MTDQSSTRRRFPLRTLAIATFAAALVFLFFGEHRVHLLGWLPFLLLLACPLLHMTMHGGHGGHGKSDASGPEAPHQRNP